MIEVSSERIQERLKSGKILKGCLKLRFCIKSVRGNERLGGDFQFKCKFFYLRHGNIIYAISRAEKDQL
jgi:hypothetical protein